MLYIEELCKTLRNNRRVFVFVKLLGELIKEDANIMLDFWMFTTTCGLPLLCDVMRWHFSSEYSNNNRRFDALWCGINVSVFKDIGKTACKQ